MNISYNPKYTVIYQKSSKNVSISITSKMSL